MDASQYMSLSRHCCKLLARLRQIRGFPTYLSELAPDSRLDHDSDDGAVTHLWDILALGFPLCFLFDLLPEDDGFSKINYSLDQERYDSNPDRAKKLAIALFIIQIRTEKVVEHFAGCEAFTIADIWDRSSTDGFAQVVVTVTALVNYLPSSVFVGHMEKLPEYVPPPSKAQETLRNNITREIVETERHYVRHLETFQNYAAVVAQSNLIDWELDRILFANSTELLNLHRKLLEKELGEIYPSYCVNYTLNTNQGTLVLTPEQERNLSSLNDLIHVKHELPAFIKWPIGRVCKYPLLIEALMKATPPKSYEHYEELKRGLQAAKRVTNTANEAQRRTENEVTVKSLLTRIDSWRGHNPETFGTLLLDDILVVVRGGVKREYHVFLFEHIVLFCKQVPTAPFYTSRANNAPLLNKGRVLLSDVTGTASSLESDPTSPTNGQHHVLTVHWKGEGSPESFILSFRYERYIKRWEKTINGLIEFSATHESGGSLDDDRRAHARPPRDAEQHVKVKVHFQDDTFVLHVPPAIEYTVLVEKVERKLGMCGVVPRGRGPLQFRYENVDGDMVLLGSSEDLRVTLGKSQLHGEQLVLYVI
ncbi:Dbl homology domain-containing protein [Mycena filopes]|nr:Dbl homology domain-containing protein [Mycena filopes]